MAKSYEEQRRERGRALFDELREKSILLVEPTEEQVDYFGDAAIYGDIQPGQDLHWICSARDYAERVLSDTPGDADVSLFWIRTGGIFLDVAPYYRGFLGTLEKGFEDVPTIALTRALVQAIEDVADGLSEDELLYLEYRRHCECHPRQTNYRARLTKGGTLREVRSKALGEERTQAETEDAIRSVLLRHGSDETRIAIEIARKLVDLLRVLETAARRVCEPLP